jgi:triacylglycerol lipase
MKKAFFKRAVLALACTSAIAAVAPTQAADTYTQTRYPIVLVHGLLGFDNIAGVQYFYGVPEALRSSGAVVFVPQQSATNSSEVRGDQLLNQLRELRRVYGYSKFNLIGHSHGGQSVRYVAAMDPGLVASVTTVGTPHQGSKVADAIKAGTSATGTTAFVASLVNGLAKLISVLSGAPTAPQDALAALTSLDTAGAQAFNRKFPQGGPTTACGQGAGVVNNVRYYSVGGTSVFTNVLDVSDAGLGLTAAAFWGEANDGLVSRCSSRWGTVLRDNYPWNHLDEVNQAFGLRGLFTPDPVAFYRSQANRLKGLGL